MGKIDVKCLIGLLSNLYPRLKWSRLNLLRGLRYFVASYV